MLRPVRPSVCLSRSLGPRFAASNRQTHSIDGSTVFPHLSMPVCLRASVQKSDFQTLPNFRRGLAVGRSSYDRCHGDCPHAT